MAYEIKIDPNDPCKIIATRIDEIEDGTCHPRVEKRTTYFDVLERAKTSQIIVEAEVKHPRIRKSVGSIRLPGLELLPCEVEPPSVTPTSTTIHESPQIVAVTNQIFPWIVFDATPTNVDEIEDLEILERVTDISFVTATPKRRFCRIKYFFEHLCPSPCRLWNKRSAKRKMEESNSEGQLLPIEEFERLHDFYQHRQLLYVHKMDDAEMAKLSWQQAAEDSMTSDGYALHESPAYLWLPQTPLLTIQEDSLEDSSEDSMMEVQFQGDWSGFELSSKQDHSRNSLDWLRDLGAKLPTMSIMFWNDLEERFRIDKFSDFSLHNYRRCCDSDCR